MTKLTHYTYVYYGSNGKPCHVGITTQKLEVYVSQLRSRHSCKGWIQQIGNKKTERAARNWEKVVGAVAGFGGGGRGLPPGRACRWPGLTSKELGSSSSLAISRTAGMTSSPISRRLRMESSWVIAPSPSQKKTLPGRRYSSTWRILGMTVLGVPEMMV